MDKYKGLLELLKLLIVVESPISFEEVCETYDGHQSYSQDTSAGKLEFRDHLLHPVHGLPVYVLFKLLLFVLMEVIIQNLCYGAPSVAKSLFEKFRFVK